MAVNDTFEIAACVAGHGWVTRQKGCILDALRSVPHITGKTSLMQRISPNYTTSYRPWQHQCGKASSQGEYHGIQWVKHACTSYRHTGKDCLWIYNSFFMDHSAELFPKLRTSTGLTVSVKNKTQNRAIHWPWFGFFVSNCVIHVHDFIQLELVRMTM